MKKLASFILLMSSTAVFACPNLSGQFQCYDDEEGYYMNTITQTGTGSKTIYTVKNDDGTTEAVRADNKWVTVTQSGQNVRTKAHCSGNMLVMTINFVDPNAGKVNAIVKMSLDASRDLKGETSITMGGNTFPAQTSICTRQ